MARRFTAGTNNVAPVSVPNLTTFSYWAWVMVSSSNGTADFNVFGKGTFGSTNRKTMSILRSANGGIVLSGAVDAATTRGNSFGGQLVAGRWYFCGSTYSDSGERIVRLFLGSETDPVQHVTYAVTAADGTIGDSSGAGMFIGSAGSGTATGDGMIETVGVADRVLSLAEFEALRLNPFYPVAGRQLMYMLGNGSPEFDFSGNGLSGTVNGTPFEMSGGPAPWLQSRMWDAPTASAGSIPAGALAWVGASSSLRLGIGMPDEL